MREARGGARSMRGEKETTPGLFKLSEDFLKDLDDALSREEWERWKAWHEKLRRKRGEGE